MRRLDVTALVFGLLLSAVALVALWQSVVGRVDWAALKIAAPLSLVVVGVVGLALSRNRS
ncbi:hypothetical protein FHX74_000812 [Friedmanniella endophytica]|uniref:Uncharacterized protein n=1 Tax=Microlunatus kandeliicorticis TaxID=1759536 RepID=A0A7W3IQ68_9ACTN|nr:hypothetical protein [Microlunatus kandeliicorticis]MBA8793218.1 hypothetical protein [Microlunatus kandeliicorticis]